MRPEVSGEGDTMYFGLIAEEEMAAGFLLASFGEVNPITKVRNYYVVDKRTSHRQMREYFIKLYSRKDIAILMLSTNVANRLSELLDSAKKILPIILRIPTKDSLSLPMFDERRYTLSDIVKDV